MQDLPFYPYDGEADQAFTPFYPFMHDVGTDADAYAEHCAQVDAYYTAHGE